MLNNKTSELHVGSEPLLSEPRFTRWLTPWSRVFLEKLVVSQLFKKSRALRGTVRFITAFTAAGHLFLSWARWIRSLASNACLSGGTSAVNCANQLSVQWIPVLLSPSSHCYLWFSYSTEGSRNTQGHYCLISVSFSNLSLYFDWRWVKRSLSHVARRPERQPDHELPSSAGVNADSI